ncbi:MAG TPA: chromate efflux transporter [Haliangiales bacterium]|nr:chromate efflux transporter [Haliangiales bacterium]
MTPLAEVALAFLRLGVTSFGGPPAHVAMMEDELVRRRAWVTRERFLDFLGATHLIPGPVSTEMALHLGRARAGMTGLVVAGLCFLLPAALMTGVLAWAYVRWGTLPTAGEILYGVKPVVIALVVQALWGLGRSAVRTLPLAVVAAASAASAAMGAHELLVLVAAGLAAALARAGGLSAVAVAPLAAPAALAAPSLAGIFGFFLKVGAVLYGSGYLLLAFLRADLVERWRWLTETQLLDAVAVGQITPGPLSSTATFVGYLLRGPAGAVVATAGIFLPAFVLVALSGPLIPRIRRSPTAGAFLDGVNAASLALMAVVGVQLGRAAIVDVWTLGLAAASAVLLLAFRVSSAWLVAGGALAGWLIHRFM